MDHTGGHSLRIDAVNLPDGGRIGMCACPGGGRGLGSGRERSADLEQDLAVIRRWGAAGLVSLIEATEFEALGLHDLPHRLLEHGLWWRHLPIRDMGTPDQRFEDRWCTEGTRLRAVLRGGGAFVLHCWAGLGRTGTVAARLLVELGSEPAEAISWVRGARPGTIQTPQQQRHVQGCRPLPR